MLLHFRTEASGKGCRNFNYLVLYSTFVRFVAQF
jgi:hypothetical protein